MSGINVLQSALFAVSLGIASMGSAGDGACLVGRESMGKGGCISGGGAAVHGDGFKAWMLEYGKEQPSQCGDYSVMGGVGALELLSAGKSDFAVYELPLPERVQNSGMSIGSAHVGVVAVAPIYNLDGLSKLRLSKKAIHAIFSGQVTRWDDEILKKDNPGVELPSISILLYHDLPSAKRRGGNAARIFMTYLEGAATSQGFGLQMDRQLVDSNMYKGAEGESGFVRSNHGALSYLWVLPSPTGFRYAAVENDFGEFVEPTPESISAATRKHAIRSSADDDLVFEQALGAYPIVAPVTIHYDRNGRKKREVEKFIAWTLSEGQSIARRTGLPWISDEMVQRELERLKQRGE